jgi:ketosteroid isomerase-like protein
MKDSSRSIVDKMFEAFAKRDVEKFVETVSSDTVWIYHGTQIIPKTTFEGKEGVRKFVSSIFDNTEIIAFEPKQFICEGNQVVVLGREHQKLKRSGKELKQDWVQIYTVENNLISRMEEFAASEIVDISILEKLSNSKAKVCV